jgi:hypothetical protein
MHSKHEPDPGFVANLEWQLTRELRRGNRAGVPRQTNHRILKTAGLILGSVALGAAAMGASQQLGESWRRELLEARLEVQLEMARQRIQMQQVAIGQSRERVAQGLRDDRDLIHLELQVAQAEADAKIMGLELEELRRSGREPLGELSSPLVDGRDFVSERIQVRLELARQHLAVSQRERDETQRQAAAGVIDQRELQARDLVIRQVELQLEALAQQLETRSAYLASEITAVEAELQLLEVEAQNRIALLDQQYEHFQLELEHARNLTDSGTLSPAVTTQMQLQLAEIEAQLRLAQTEREILRRELERRAAQR